MEQKKIKEVRKERTAAYSRWRMTRHRQEWDELLRRDDRYQQLIKEGKDSETQKTEEG